MRVIAFDYILEWCLAYHPKRNLPLCVHNFTLVQAATMTDRCLKQYNGILELRWAMAEIEQKKQKLIELLSTQVAATEGTTEENRVGVNTNRNR